MATGRCIPREKATAALTALLETVCAGEPYADCVTAVYVFGSYARGALTVGDVDTDIEYDAKLDPGVEREMVDNLVVGRDWNTPFRKALKPARALQLLLERHTPHADTRMRTCPARAPDGRPASDAAPRPRSAPARA